MSFTALGDLLFNALIVVGLALDIPVAFIVLRAAWKRPRYWSLLLMAYVVVAIAVLVVVSVWAATNTAQGYPVPQDVVRFVFRVSLLFLALFSPLFLYAYRTGKFVDGGHT